MPATAVGADLDKLHSLSPILTLDREREGVAVPRNRAIGDGQAELAGPLSAFLLGTHRLYFPLAAIPSTLPSGIPAAWV